MLLIASKLGKNEKYDQLRCERRDGSETGTMIPLPRGRCMTQYWNWRSAGRPWPATAH
ncbi:hypothetical protein [Duganella qianjiadongensis]|uniref:Uncharacterized protein n=1 Tax=Duganella qianjiadongensis TaxID=2692176 RepID=A0ABW9VGZ7_9BURK|nr:hypothetical protein [Duganella qianjiadongensis]MYM37853.1 hypothetical protein [Duganella qianjiadongensis]